MDASGTSGTSTSLLDPDKHVSCKVRQSGSSKPVDQVNSTGSGDRVLKRFSPPVTITATPTQTKTSRSTRSSSPPVKKMPIPHFARPAPDRDHPVRDKKPRHQEPARSSGSAGSSGDTSMTIRGSCMDESGGLTSSSVRDFQGSTTSSTIHRESQVLVPSSGTGQITAVNISGLAGGTQSVRLKSWDEPLRYPLVEESKVRENFQQLLQICRACNTPPPPEFEARYFASILTGADIRIGQLFPRVRVHWTFYLAQPWTRLDPEVTDDQRGVIQFAHATDTGGVAGIVRHRFVVPATLADGNDAVGHYRQGTLWSDAESLTSLRDRAAMSGKWKQPLIILGECLVADTHYTMKSGGGLDAQNRSQVAGAVRMRKDKKWVFHSSLRRITGITVTVVKQYTSRRDAAGLPQFHLGLNRTEELAQQLQDG